MQNGTYIYFNVYLICLCIFVSPSVLFGQTYGPAEDRFLTIRQNSNSTLEASGQTVWIGPGLNAFNELTGEIFVPTNADSVFNGRGRVFSLEVHETRIFAGLGFTSTRGGSTVNAAQGYYQSNNSGGDWSFISFPLDDRADESCDAASIGPPCDIEFQYGDETYIRTRITVPEQSPPYEVDFHDQTLFSTNWASGVLRSRDNGQTWERIILPPSNVSNLNPGESYGWVSVTTGDEIINRYDPRFDNNLLGFGLLIDDQQRVWVGTAAGINISENALTAPVDQIRWKHISWNPDISGGLLSNWIITIRQQPDTDRIWMTNWITDSENRDAYGVIYTDDQGETFHPFLEGVRANDIGFFDGNIYIAADNGLYISNDDGENWERISQISSPNTFIKPDARYFAVASTEDNLWVGTSDGIASTSDGGESWRILRVEVPLSGGNRYQPDAPNVNTYAYPNPFSPTQHSLIRIKYEMEEPGPATIRIFDFGMNPVKTIRVPAVSSSGAYETTWNGQTETGRIASNGTYFYSIETSNGFMNGKILLLD
ncbi:MAG: FlgD immunoglobulin-like domain containing protein [Balneolaceae bacterium]|nr:FlgD immunoglobulin-like domain containing protein [Balneolaceae bacterium]